MSAISKVNQTSHGPRYVGARIGFRRRELGMTQGRLAALVGISRETICRIENGADFSVQTLARIASAMDADAHQLLFGERLKWQ